MYLLVGNKPVDTSIRSPRTLSLGRAGGTLCGRGHSIRTVLPSCTDNDRRLPSPYSEISAVTENKKLKSLSHVLSIAVKNEGEPRYLSRAVCVGSLGLFIVALSDSIHA